MTPYSITEVDVSTAWVSLVQTLLQTGNTVRPRGLENKELGPVQFNILDAQQNILFNDKRKVAYRFMVAEWLWIWYGLDDVATIEQYNPHIRKYSDDGMKFEGAYGPRLKYQWPYIFRTIDNDPDTRQAVATIFSPYPKPSLDIPCTLSFHLMVREGVVHSIVNMRSSDVWLGLPYDVFNFSMFQNIIASRLGMGIGGITFNLDSSHLYAGHYEQAYDITFAGSHTLRSPRLGVVPPGWLLEILHNPTTTLEPTGPGLYEEYAKYGRVLQAKTNKDALRILEGSND